MAVERRPAMPGVGELESWTNQGLQRPRTKTVSGLKPVARLLLKRGSLSMVKHGLFLVGGEK